MGETMPLYWFNIMGFKLSITFSVVEQWIVMVFIICAVLILVRKFETIPKGRQLWIETIVDSINGVIKSVLGDEYQSFTPFIGSLMIFLLLLNLVGLTGFKPPTADYSVALGLAVVSFGFVQGAALKGNGIKHYVKGIIGPVPAMAPLMVPLNILDRCTLPVSLSMRLFGNMMAASTIVELAYEGLDHMSRSITGSIPILQGILPIPIHGYFDLFDGAIQTFIFIILTMVNAKIIVEE